MQEFTYSSMEMNVAIHSPDGIQGKRKIRVAGEKKSKREKRNSPERWLLTPVRTQWGP